MEALLGQEIKVDNHRGERWIKEPGFRHTVKPDDRDFFRNPDSLFVQSEHRPQGNQVVGSEDGRKSTERLLDQTFSRLISPLRRPGCLQTGPRLKPRLGQRIEPTSFSKLVASPRRFAKESGNLLMAKVNQVLGGRPRA